MNSKIENLRIPVYAEGKFYSDNPSLNQSISDLLSSGFTTLILSLFHIGSGENEGDIYYNSTLIISKGQYVGDAKWTEQLSRALGGTIKEVCASIGGGGVVDYETIRTIYNENRQSFAGTMLWKNMQVFNRIFPFITIIDMDCEETYDEASFVAFCQMLVDIGFGITFCPYTEQLFWSNSLAALQASHPGAVKWWNLQCYAGGEGNEPKIWAEAIQKKIPKFNTNGFIIPGDSTNGGVSAVETLIKTFNNEASVGGGFIWTLDNIINEYPNNSLEHMKAYVNAIRSGLEK